jgi:heavy metal translocating P-type ATPase
VLLFSGWPFLSGAASGLRNHRFNMDSLISLGLLTTFGYSLVALLGGGETYFESVVMVIFFLLIGRFLETVVRGRSGNVTEGLMGLQGKWAVRLEASGERVVAVEEIAAGDRLLVRTGESVPADGIVSQGESELDESALTGESRLRAVSVGGAVTGGTINRGAAFVMQARQVGAETALARICRLVEQAQTRKPHVQLLADRIAGRSVWIVQGLAAATFAYWQWLAPAPGAQPAWVTAIAVLIVACPCALGLATPLAVIAGSALAARRGVLVKGGDVLERAARVTDVVLDKTGTLTTGGFAVRDALTFAALPEREWLPLAAALESRTLHPIADSLRAYAAQRWPVPATAEVADARVVAGRGVSGQVDRRTVIVGNRQLLEESGIVVPAVPPQASPIESCTEVWVAVDGAAAGLLRLADPLRPHAEALVSALRDQGIRPHLYSGDRPEIVDALARKLGIASARGGMRPDDKLATLQALQQQGRTVAMVGDGVNDAPALTQADLGIALSTGSDIALDAAHVILMRSRLEGTLEALEIARRTRRTIAINLGLSVGYNAIAIPVAMLGWLTPLLAAIAMSCSSLLVVVGAMTLRWSGAPAPQPAEPTGAAPPTWPAHATGLGH